MDFGQNNSAGVVIAAVGVSRGIFWAVLLGKTMIFDCFSYSERKCSGLCIKLTAGCLKLQSTCREKFLTWEKRKNEEFSVILYSELDKWTLDKTVWHGLSKLHSACPEESFEHFSLEKRWLLKDFRTLSRKSSGLCQKSMAGFPKLQTTCPEKNFERENFWKNDDFVVILYFEWKKNGFWATQFGRGCHSCTRRFQRNLLSICHWKNDEFWMKFVLWAKKFRTLPKFYCRFPKLQSTCQEKNCEREWNWKNDDSLVILKLWVKKLDSEQNNWAGVVKTTFGVSRGILWQFFNEKRLVFHVFLHFEQNHCLLLPNIYGRVSETSIYVSGGKNWEKKNEKKRLFLGNFVLWVKKIGLRAKQFGKGCQSFIRRVQRNLFRFFYWKNDDIWMIFALWAKKFRTLPKIYGRVSETSNYVSGEKFWERKTLKKWRLLSNFVLWVKKVGFWAKQFWQGLS